MIGVGAMSDQRQRPVAKPTDGAARLTAEAALEQLERESGGLATPYDSLTLSANRLIRTPDGKTLDGRSQAAPSPTRLPESVIGEDDRVRVLDPENYPWRMICALKIKVGGEFVGSGTGWLAGPRTVITAGHCVHDAQLGGWAESIRVIPARADEEEPFSHQDSTDLRTVQGWIDSADPKFDYAAIILDQPFPGIPEVFRYGVRTDSSLSGKTANVAGYPYDLHQSKYMYHHSDPIQSIGASRFFYKTDTFGGQSGAPVFFWENGQPLVVGIHTYGVGGGFVSNSATRINGEVFDNIDSWVSSI